MVERYSKPAATVGAERKTRGASEPQPEDAESPEEVFECVVNLAGRFRGAIKSITLLCNAGTADSILCPIDASTECACAGQYQAVRVDYFSRVMVIT